MDLFRNIYLALQRDAPLASAIDAGSTPDDARSTVRPDDVRRSVVASIGHNPKRLACPRDALHGFRESNLGTRGRRHLDKSVVQV